MVRVGAFVYCSTLLICLTPTTLYRSKIPLHLIKIKEKNKKNAEQIDQINPSNILEGYDVISVSDCGILLEFYSSK